MTNSDLHTLSSIYFNPKAADEYLLTKQVFYEEMTCSKCGSQMIKYIERWAFRCSKRTCRNERSINSHTFFAATQLKRNEILLLAKLWLSKISVTAAIELTGHSSKTVVKFYQHFRQLVESSLEFEDTIIGGEGITVDVDETKLGRRKYNRGHRVEGVWVVVGIERTPERKVFVIPVENRNREVLERIIKNHVLPGSLINTDCWRGYSWIDNDDNYEHRTVNHSIGFKDELTGTHTNYAEGTNSGIKRRIAVRSRVREGIEQHLAEFIWRRKCEGNNIWDKFIEVLQEIHYDII